MSFNLNTRVNNLSLQVAQITASSVENPLVNNLDCNNNNIINCGTLSSTSGLPMNINSPNSYTYFNNQAVFNDTLTINNNTANNGLVVKDQNVDTSCFVVDMSGNVGVKVNASTPMTTDFTVNGNALVSGSITANSINAGNVLNNITAGTGLVKTGTSTNPTLSLSSVGTSGTYTNPSSISTDSTGRISSITSGTAPVTSVTAGTGISVTGTSTSPIINNTGVNSLTAGGGISITGTSTNPIITATATAPNLSQVLTTGNDAGGQTINNVGLLNGYINQYPAQPTPIIGVNSSAGTWGGLINNFLGSTGIGLKNVTYLSGLTATTANQNKPAVSIVPDNQTVGIWRYEPEIGYALDVNGNTLIEADLDVSGNVDISGSVNIQSNAGVKGNLAVIGNLTAPNMVNSITTTSPLSASSSTGNVNLSIPNNMLNLNLGNYIAQSVQNFSYAGGVVQPSYPFNVCIAQLLTVNLPSGAGPTTGCAMSTSVYFNNLSVPASIANWTVTPFLSDVGGDGYTNRLLYNTITDPNPPVTNLGNGLFSLSWTYFNDFNFTSGHPIYLYLALTPSNAGDETQFSFSTVNVTTYTVAYPTKQQ